MLSVCLGGSAKVEILDWQHDDSQTSGELDGSSWFKSFGWKWAFVVIHADIFLWGFCSYFIFFLVLLPPISLIYQGN